MSMRQGRPSSIRRRAGAPAPTPLIGPRPAVSLEDSAHKPCWNELHLASLPPSRFRILNPWVDCRLPGARLKSLLCHSECRAAVLAWEGYLGGPGTGLCSGGLGCCGPASLGMRGCRERCYGQTRPRRAWAGCGGIRELSLGWAGGPWVGWPGLELREGQAGPRTFPKWTSKLFLPSDDCQSVLGGLWGEGWLL